MRARIIIVHDDAKFVTQVAAELRVKGHEVMAISDPTYVVQPPRFLDRLEITTTRATGDQPGIRIRVTGLPSGEPYAGVLGSFIAEPVSVDALMISFALFGL
jgi:hypothetical protein